MQLQLWLSHLHFICISAVQNHFHSICLSLMHWSNTLCVRQSQKLKISQRMSAHFCYPPIFLSFRKPTFPSILHYNQRGQTFTNTITWIYEVIFYLLWCLYFPKPYANHASNDINKDPQWGGVIWISCDKEDCGVLTVLNFGFQDFQGEENYFWSVFDLIWDWNKRCPWFFLVYITSRWEKDKFRWYMYSV